MYKSLFPNFEDQSRIWIYGLSRQLINREDIIVKNYLNNFIKTWKSHGDDVTGAYEILLNRFVIITAQTSSVSGCSIDSSVSIFKELHKKYKLNVLDLDLVFYRDVEEIKSVKRLEFDHLIRTHEITLDSIVFDTTIQTLGLLRQGQFELPVRNSWHINLIKNVA